MGLVQLLVATDQRDKARIAANDAEEMISLRAKPLAMGYIYEALGENKQAGEAYQKAVNAQPDQPQAVRNLADFYLRSGDIRRATPLIERVLSGKLPSSESDLVSARRMMAAILVNQGYSKGYSKMKEAARLVDRNLESTLAQPEDKRLKILILLADPRQARGPDVLELAESLVNKGAAEPEPDDRLQLARLYLARGDWEHCREQMEKLVNGTQSNPHYLAAYVRMLLDQNQLSDADMWLERLEKAAASNPGLTVDLHAELLQRRKEWGKVPGFLAAYVSQAKTDQDRLDRMLVAAQCVERLGGELTAPGRRNWPRATSTRPGHGTNPMSRNAPAARCCWLPFMPAAARSLPRSISSSSSAPRPRPWILPPPPLPSSIVKTSPPGSYSKWRRCLPPPWRRRKSRSPCSRPWPS